MKYQAVSFNRGHWGLIAQEVKTLLDELGIDSGVFIDPAYDGKEGAMGIRYNELIPVLIKAVQELAERKS